MSRARDFVLNYLLANAEEVAEASDEMFDLRAILSAIEELRGNSNYIRHNLSRGEAGQTVQIIAAYFPECPSKMEYNEDSGLYCVSVSGDADKLKAVEKFVDEVFYKINA